MDEYVSKHYLIAKFNALADRYAGNEHKRQRALAYTTAADIIESVDAADVQPVVHCKDCKHRKERHYEESGEKPYIKYECKFTKYSMSDEGFCSFGSRKDDEQNDERGEE